MDFSFALDNLWVLVGAVIVFAMQAGFAMLETGLTRAKNAGNIMMKNIVDFCIGTIVYWFIGFGIMFGDTIGGVLGKPGFFANPSQFTNLPAGLDPMVFLIFQTVFCGTAATIVSGAMAERTKFAAYCIYSAVISMLIYPISGHWIWGGGWLSQLGFIDFAGSTAVHLVGGICALVGAIMVGPRIGKFTRDGKSRAILGHSLPLSGLGFFLLWFGWFGFNGASSLAIVGNEGAVGRIFVNTNIAAAAGTVSVIAVTWIKYKKPDVSMAMNGGLAGLVAITAGCSAVDPFGALVIGLLSGIVVFFGIELLDKKFHVDDPVGAVGVHCINGAFGTIMVGFFATDGGLFYGGGFRQLGVQTLGVIAVGAWVTATILLTFFLIKKIVGIRVSDETQFAGLDIGEHGLDSAYADFAPVVNGRYFATQAVNGKVTMEEAIPVKETLSDKKGVKITKCTIICNNAKFEALKTALGNIGVTGMTVTHVMGCGIQKGHTEFYRGVETELNLLPKVQVDTVVSKVPVEEVIKAAKSALYTGKMGDGKIFVYDVEDVVKISTNQYGYDALQDD
jgi:ammonium transporter